MRSDITVINGLAARRDGLVTRAELIGRGISRTRIQTCLDSEYMTAVLRGIYLVGAPLLDQRSLMQAALLLAGNRSQLSHRTAAEHRQLLRARAGFVTVSTPRQGIRSPQRTKIAMTDGGSGIVTVHPSTDLRTPDLVDGLPTSPVPRALVDIGGESGDRVLGWAWKEAEFRGQLDLSAIATELERPRRPGVVLVRRRLADHRVVMHEGDDVRSRRELAFLRLVDAAGLPAPEKNVRLVLEGRVYYADFLWRHLGLVVELDGHQHLTPRAGADDRLRDVEFYVGELDVLRILDSWLDDRPEWCVDRLRAAMHRQATRLGVSITAPADTPVFRPEGMRLSDAYLRVE